MKKSSNNHQTCLVWHIGDLWFIDGMHSTWPIVNLEVCDLSNNSQSGGLCTLLDGFFLASLQLIHITYPQFFLICCLLCDESSTYIFHLDGYATMFCTGRTLKIFSTKTDWQYLQAYFFLEHFCPSFSFIPVTV